MTPIVSVVGRSNSGKTYLLERLIPHLTSKGYRIATVKHDVHGFEIDREGKDSWRHKAAGASAVVLASPKKIAVVKDLQEEWSLERIRSAWIQDADLILTEGYKRADYPKIEVSLFGDRTELLCTPEDQLIAVVSNRPWTVGVPVFPESEIHRLADLLERLFLRGPGTT